MDSSKSVSVTILLVLMISASVAFNPMVNYVRNGYSYRTPTEMHSVGTRPEFWPKAGRIAREHLNSGGKNTSEPFSPSITELYGPNVEDLSGGEALEEDWDPNMTEYARVVEGKQEAFVIEKEAFGNKFVDEASHSNNKAAEHNLPKEETLDNSLRFTDKAPGGKDATVVQDVSFSAQDFAAIPKERVTYSTVEEQTEFAAGVTGFVAGSLIAGPIGGVMGTALANYLARKDSVAGDYARGAGRIAMGSFNSIKSQIISAAQANFEKMASEGENGAKTVAEIEKAWTKSVESMQQLDDQHNLVSRFEEYLREAGDFSEDAIDQAVGIVSKIQKEQQQKNRMGDW
mmetsp:Transcript_37372/g.61160  ORF Transcript_37372/g.61160 Transcript_37372/m.61160 type:complete len:344 (+) Transcript_37372:162-1193(+)